MDVMTPGTHPPLQEAIGRRYPACRAAVGEGLWAALEAVYSESGGEDPLSRAILLQADRFALPAFLAELARLEEVLCRSRELRPAIPFPPAERCLNPTLQAVETRWKGLPERVLGRTTRAPVPGDAVVLAWCGPRGGEERLREASPADLLALKVVAEGADLRSVAREAGVGVGALEGVIQAAVEDGLVLAPPSQLRRDPEGFPTGEERFLTAASFTLQWHLTQACDLRCRHCYDRSDRPPLGLAQGLRVLDQLFDFCRERRVSGQVTLSGGNPLLYPDFLELYRASWERGFMTGILGNPAPRERIEEIVAVEPPDFFQVSLEGLPEHNDRIRGPGHFRRTLEFLDVLRDLGVYSMVMLTLTRENLGQVLALGEALRGRADVFHFNRLSPVGEGASLALPEPGVFAGFLESYLEAAEANPILGIKDNLFNPLLRSRGLAPFGGCTGHGCGAAFNFLSLLADGAVHACRKFSSPVGDIREMSLAQIYDSPAAARYREGSGGCRGCDLRPVCGGCLSAASGGGLDPFRERDPFCAYSCAPAAGSRGADPKPAA